MLGGPVQHLQILGSMGRLCYMEYFIWNRTIRGFYCISFAYKLAYALHSGVMPLYFCHAEAMPLYFLHDISLATDHQYF